MRATITSLLYKKYSLKIVQGQLGLFLVLTLLLCILSLIPIQVNGITVSLTMEKLIAILAFLFIIPGLVNGQVELASRESKQFYLLKGKKSSTALFILLVELVDCCLQALMTSVFVILFFGTIHRQLLAGVEVFLCYLLGCLIYSQVAYYLTLLLKSSLSTLAILLLFPLLLFPYLERVFPLVAKIFFYQSIAETIQGQADLVQKVSVLVWLILLYLLVLRQLYVSLRKGG